MHLTFTVGGGVSDFPNFPRWFTNCCRQMRIGMAQQRLPLFIFPLVISVHIIILTPPNCHHQQLLVDSLPRLRHPLPCHGAGRLLQTNSSWLRLIWVKWLLRCCGLGRDSPTDFRNKDGGHTRAHTHTHTGHSVLLHAGGVLKFHSYLCVLSKTQKEIV